MKKYLVILTFFIMFCQNVFASELTFLVGTDISNINNDKSTAYSIEYRYLFMKYFAWSVAYLNEGHHENHKRDGILAKGWVSTNVFTDKFTLGFGVGPYLYYDTTNDDINHGVALVASIAATYYIKSPFFLRATFDRVTTFSNNDSDILMAGVGVGFTF